jgi:PEGA domain
MNSPLDDSAPGADEVSRSDVGPPDGPDVAHDLGEDIVSSSPLRIDPTPEVTSGSTIVWQDQPAPAALATLTRHDWFVGVAMSACLSTCVALLALWLWGQSQGRGADAMGVLTVTYESMDADSQGTSGAARASIDATASAPAEATPSPAREIARDTADARAASSVIVTTEPAGARVTVNGVGYGSTPLAIRYLPPGTKRIRVTKSGYRTEERVVAVDDGGAAARLRIALRELPRPRTSR